MSSRLAALAVASLFLGLVPVATAESNADVMIRFSTSPEMDNIPPGCQPFQWIDEEDPDDPNPCHAIATSMNGLDSPKVDVLLMAPASPTAERDLRIMRQATQMWADGLQWMSADMGIDWLAETLEFRISTQIVDDAAAGGFTEYAIADPEIVVIASNPVGGIGIGIDPLWFYSQVFGDPEAGEGPCHGIKQPFLLEAWQGVPGFDSHHGTNGGTYVEDCDGAGGNICFSVNGAIDPATGVIDIFQLYDLVAHENGHCLTLGHVGDGAEGSWASVPTNDIMAYSPDPFLKSKCVSSLDVEGFVVSMSKYIDTNGDGVVDDADRIWANDAIGEGDGRPFQVQQPDNHYYASPTRQAEDCPQPSFSPNPLDETRDFKPDAPPRSYLAVHDRLDGEHVAHGLVNFRGNVSGGVPEHIEALALPVPTVMFEDPEGDSAVPHFDILSVDANMTDDELVVVVTYGGIRPDEGSTVAPQYGLQIGAATFYAWDDSLYATYDSSANTITFRLSREVMAGGIDDDLSNNFVLEAPYHVRAYVYSAPGHGDLNFDYAPALRDPRLVIGETPDVPDSEYVVLSGANQTVTVPIMEDGTWSANLDLSSENATAEVLVTAAWYSAAGNRVDSDRVLVVADPLVPVDMEAVRAAGAGPGAGEADVPGPGLLLLLGALAVAGIAARRRR